MGAWAIADNIANVAKEEAEVAWKKVKAFKSARKKAERALDRAAAKAEKEG